MRDKQSVFIFYNNKVPVGNNITILHCNTEYPTPFEDVNLNAINDLKTLPQE
ncbi:N-acetylneuraminate synthase family protein [Escherichia coli]|uniref:N-acetylneuraminate synthase family protein n=1 Tax=Escherichia coli TaxID=562 RepID=UPI00332F5717